MDVKAMQEKLLDRYKAASDELLFVMFPTSYGISERFGKQLGLLQISKTAATIDNLISKQREYLLDTILADEAEEEEEIEAGKSLTEDKKNVMQNAKRVFDRAAKHVEKAMALIQGSQIYQIATSEEAKRLKLRQRQVSAFKIVENLSTLLNLIEKKRSNLAERAQKITLSPMFEQFRSREPSAAPFKSRTRNKPASASPKRSKSPSAKPFIPGQWKYRVYEGEDVVDTMEDEEGEVQYLVRLSPSAVERAKKYTFGQRVRMNYNF